jgi:hypothetical protein
LVLAEFSISGRLLTRLVRWRLWPNLWRFFSVMELAMSKSDRGEIILFAIYSGVPLLCLIGVLALLTRYMVLA